MADVQTSQHNAAQIVSSQTTCVPSPDNQLPTSGQDSKNVNADAQENPSGTRSRSFTDNVDPTTNGNLSSKSLSFSEAIQQYQEELEQDFLRYEQDLKKKDPQDVEDEINDWDLLENTYQKDVGNIIAQEQDVMERFDARFKQFLLWMQVSNERETSRALKRIKTQAAFVQNSEGNLARQEQHYERVMEAFQSAMQLLSRPS